HCRHSLEELVHVAKEKVVLVAVVRVKGSAADAGVIQNILHGDVVEMPLVKQLHQGAAESVASALHPLILFATGSRGVSEQNRPDCLVLRRAHAGHTSPLPWNLWA